MIRPRIRLLLALAAVAVVAGGAIAGGGIAGGATAGRPTLGGPKAAGPATTPTINVQPEPGTCFVVGRVAPDQTCSIHPCVEFVAPRLRVAQPRILPRARLICDANPSPRGHPVRIRR